MAEKPAGERTEAPTPERLRKARQEGQIPVSQEVPSALMLLVLLVVGALTGNWLGEWFQSQLRLALGSATISSNGPDALLGHLKSCAAGAMGVMAPVMIATVAASIFSSTIVSGWSASSKALAIRLDRLSPGTGLRNLFSSNAAATLTIAVAKIVLICLIAWAFLRDKVGACLELRWAGPQHLVSATAQLVVGLTGRLVLAMVAVALADLIYQKWHYTRTMRMTRQEVKEERRQYEPSPEIRARVRAIQYEMSRRRMLLDVPTADVVVVNPTHVAVALRYEAATMDAPLVVAKGPDLLCERIKEIAREHDVPVVEKPELARALYAAVDVGQSVPEALFVAVAEVLAMIYRLRNRAAAAARKVYP
jgi:flagellar biosynthetic protein FlhB